MASLTIFYLYTVKPYTSLIRNTNLVIYLCFLELQLYDIAPALRIFPLPFRKGFQYFDQIKQHILEVVGEHKMSRVAGKPRDLIDIYHLYIS